MKIKLILPLLTIFLLNNIVATKAFAVENPLHVNNNKVGIHILFDHELKDASLLVNSNKGDWGYAIVVIQAGDKDLNKWQKFMDEAKRYHVIPIIRLATEGDFFNTKVWRKPNDKDIVDFANFLDSLDWPVKNRYVSVFNEVNRGDEWGGSANPAEYAQLLSFAVSVFKSKSPDFFIITAGLDNAAPNQPDLYINEYNYMRQMNTEVPGIFNQVDGLASHSYPNPGFSMPPSFDSPTGIDSFKYERALSISLGSKDLPIFITETGWSTEAIPDNIAANYYKEALSTVWSDPGIVAVTPFLLQGSGSPFQKFSLLGSNNSFTQQYTSIKSYPKIKGSPTMPNKVLSAESSSLPGSEIKQPTIRDFSNVNISELKIAPSKQLKSAFKWLLKI